MLQAACRPMTYTEEIHARQKFVADLEARNYQTRAWNTLTNGGRLWRSGVLAHDPRFDGPPSVAIKQNFTQGFYRPGAQDEANTLPNPAQLNAPRNAVALAIKPVQEYNRANTGAPRVSVEQSMPVESGQLGYDASLANLKRLAAEAAQKALIISDKEEKELSRQAKKAAIQLARTAAAKETSTESAMKEEMPMSKTDTTQGQKAQEAAEPAVRKPEEEPNVASEIDKLHETIMSKLKEAGGLPRTGKNWKKNFVSAAKEIAALLIQYDNLRKETGKNDVNDQSLQEFAVIAKSNFVAGAPNAAVGQERWNEFDTNSGISNNTRSGEPHPFKKWLGLGKMSSSKRKHVDRESPSTEAKEEAPKRTRRNSRDSAVSMEKKLLSM
jgi:hypothetical protein